MGSAVVKPLTRRRGKIKANEQVANGREGNREADPGSCEPHLNYTVDSLADPVSNLCKPISVKSGDVDAEQTRAIPVGGSKFERSGLAPYDSDEEPYPIQLARTECSKQKQVLDKKKIRNLSGIKQNNGAITQESANQVSYVPHKPLADRDHPPSSSEHFRFRRITALFQKNGTSAWPSFRRKPQKEIEPDNTPVPIPSNSKTRLQGESEKPVDVNIEEKDVCCDARTPSPEYDELEDLAVVNPSPKAADRPEQHSTSSHVQEAASSTDIERRGTNGVFISSHVQEVASSTDMERTGTDGVFINTTDQPAPEKAGELRSEVGHVIFITPSPSKEHTCDCQVDQVFPLKLSSLENMVANLEPVKCHPTARTQEICCINVPENGHATQHESLDNKAPSVSNSEEICLGTVDVRQCEENNDDYVEPNNEKFEYETSRRYSTLSMPALTSLWPNENTSVNMPTLPAVEEIAEFDRNDNEDDEKINGFTGKPAGSGMHTTSHVTEVIGQDSSYIKSNSPGCSSRSSSANSNNTSAPDSKPGPRCFSARTPSSPLEVETNLPAFSHSRSTGSPRDSDSNLQSALCSGSKNSTSFSSSNLKAAENSESQTSLKKHNVSVVTPSSSNNSKLQLVTPSQSKNSVQRGTPSEHSVAQSFSKSSMKINCGMHVLTPSESKHSLQRCISDVQNIAQSDSKHSLHSITSDIQPVVLADSKHSLQRCVSDVEAQSDSEHSLHRYTSDVQAIDQSESKHSFQRSISDVQAISQSESKTSQRNNDSCYQTASPCDSQHSPNKSRSYMQAKIQVSRSVSGPKCQTDPQAATHDLENSSSLQERPSSTVSSGDTPTRNSGLEHTPSDSHHHQNTPAPCASQTNVRQSLSHKSVGNQEEDKSMSRQNLLKLDTSMKTETIRGRPTSEKLYTPLGNVNVLKSRPISASELYPLSNFPPLSNGPTKLPPIHCAAPRVNRPTSGQQSVSKSEEFLPSSRPGSGRSSDSRPHSSHSRVSSKNSRPTSATGSNAITTATIQWDCKRHIPDTGVDNVECHFGEGERLYSRNDVIKDVDDENMDPYTKSKMTITSVTYHDIKLQPTECSREGGDSHLISSVERCCMPSMLAPCISKTSVVASRSGEVLKPSIVPSRSGEVLKPSILPRLSSSATKEEVNSSSTMERPNSSAGPGSARVSWNESPTGEGREAYSHQVLSLSHDQIGSIRQQLYEEGLKPAERDGGVAFFIPMTIDGLQPQANGGTISDRLTRSRKCSLNYEERLLLANINRQAQLHKRKEFAVKDIQNVKGATSGSEGSDRNKQEDDFDIDWDSAF